MHCCGGVERQEFVIAVIHHCRHSDLMVRAVSLEPNQMMVLARF